ncbi:uncharacterized protein LOC143201577 [Rhynchophorus ferrugineus]
MRDLNLLLRQQSSSNLLATSEDCPKEDNGRSGNTSDNENADYQQLKVELINVQVEESVALERHMMLYTQYNLQETVIEHILNNIESIILEIQSSNRLHHYLNLYCLQEKYLDDNLSTYLAKTRSTPDLSTLETTKNNLLVALNRDDRIKTLKADFEQKYNNFKLALKNLKIILEILNVQNDCLDKLKRQFHEVLIEYRQCRRLLDKELPFGIAERGKLLSNSLSSLGESYGGLNDRIRLLSGGIGVIVEKMKEQKYVLVKKEIGSLESISE